MKKITLKVSFLLVSGLFALTANAQQTGAKKFGKKTAETAPCGTTQYEELLKKRNPARKDNAQFEQWIAPKVAEAKRKSIQKDGNAIVTIPVVFHIIHNGSPVGVNENIADGQILSQIEVLNEDFRRATGTNGFNTHPDGADMEINFCLAKQDPDGLLTTGIVRYPIGSGEGWSMEEAEVIKTQTIWNPEKYLNIWVFDEIYGLAGYAQFPTQSGLEGLEGEGLPTTANTDGVALGHLFVGSEEKFPDGTYDSARNLGRSASHEVGHFFGLRHIWGDGFGGECGATDYCDDTPFALEPTPGCPAGPVDSCTEFPGNDMIENYMDYTDDACLNIFTQDQKARMQAVLANSPRRHSLTTSNGCVEGIVAENDGSLRINRIDTECGENTFNAELVISNSGTNTLTSAVITYHINEQEPLTYNWNGSLATGESDTIELPQITMVSGNHTFHAAIETINNLEDSAPFNSTKALAFEISQKYATSSVKITIKTDNAGGEVLWGFGAETDEEMLAGNINFENIWDSDWYGNNETHTVTVNVDTDDCYTFFMLDFGANGICCENGNGFYKIETADGTLIAEGGEFFDSEQIYFAIDAVAGTKNVAESANFNLYPNPANSVLNIAVADGSNMPENYTVYNSLGQIMDSGNITAATQTIDIARYAAGVYFVKVTKGAEAKTLQFIKQ